MSYLSRFLHSIFSLFLKVKILEFLYFKQFDVKKFIKLQLSTWFLKLISYICTPQSMFGQFIYL
jgi:hypothetical protein